MTASLFTFDSTSRAITALSSGERWVLCEHLAGPLDALLYQPAAIVTVAAGTKIDLNRREI